MQLLSLSLFLPLLHQVVAIRIPFKVQVTNNPVGSITRRAVAVGNHGNAQYIANITVAGSPVPVLLDSGSSDLWVYFENPPADPGSLVDTKTHVELSYAIGVAKGNAHRTSVEFGGYALKDQALLIVDDPSGFTVDGDFHAQGYDGLFGFGPNSGSLVRKKLKKTNADTTMQRIFNNAGMDDNYVTFLLDRQKDSNDPFTGEMTIGEIIPGWENITSAEKLDVETVTRLLKSDQHWQALTDKDKGVIGPDGKVIEIDSIVPRAPDGQLVAVIDSGFTFSQVPREMADAIYGRVPGAIYDSKSEWWLIPCGQYLNIAFNFGGVTYPVHPLDTVDDNFSVLQGGKKVCIGSFQPITSAFSLLGHYDMILGMNFLRSVYTLLNFGSWIDGPKSKTKEVHPYIQMVSHTNVAEARRDFVGIRLNGVDTIDTDDRWKLLPVEQLQKSPVSDEEKKKKYQEMILSRWPYIFVGCLVGLALIIGFCIYKCCCRKKGRKGDKGLKGNKNLGFGFGKQRQAEQEEYYNSGMGGKGYGDSKGESYLPLESQTHLSAKYGASTASLNEATPQKPYHDAYSSSNLDLSRTYSTHSAQGAGFPLPPQQPQHSPYPSPNDYRQSGQSGYSYQGQGYPQGGYPQQQQSYDYDYAQPQPSPYPPQGQQGYGGQQGYDYGYQAR